MPPHARHSMVVGVEVKSLHKFDTLPFETVIIALPGIVFAMIINDEATVLINRDGAVRCEFFTNSDLLCFR